MSNVFNLGKEPPFATRPDEPPCECTDENRMCIPTDWGWRCHDCGQPIPSAVQS